MDRPDLSKIVDTYIPLAATTLDDVVDLLRTKVIKDLRALQHDGKIGWFSFLIHNPENMLARTPPVPPGLYIHIRICPCTNISPEDLIKILPKHFERAEPDPNLSKISGINPSLLNNHEWAEAWKIVGEASEWVASLIESHSKEVPPSQIFQFLHFITNALRVDNCLYYQNCYIHF